MKFTELPTTTPRDAAFCGEQVCSVSGAKYRLLEVIGEGAIGVVYKAIKIEGPISGVASNYAIKILLPILSVAKTEKGFERIKERFIEEARRSRGLDNKNILKTIDHGNIQSLKTNIYNGLPFYVTYLIDGTSLDEKITKTNLPFRKRLDLAIQLCEAISYLHRNQILHRDIKPQNIIVTSDQNLVLCDFGVSQWNEFEKQYSDGFKTGENELLTSSCYMPPEAELKPKDYSMISESWSLGKTLLEIMSWKLYKRVEIISSNYELKIGFYSHELMEIVTSLLDIDPDKRIYATDSCLKLLEFKELVEDAPDLDGLDIDNMNAAVNSIKAHDPNDSYFEVSTALFFVDNPLYEIDGPHVAFEKVNKDCPVCGSIYTAYIYQSYLETEFLLFFVCFGKPGKPCGHLFEKIVHD